MLKSNLFTLEEKNSMEIRAADDFHVHVRNDERTAPSIRGLREGGVVRALIMPNTVPAIETGDEAQTYKDQLLEHDPGIDYLMTVKLSPKTKPESILEAGKKGVIAGKQYPDGVTTNSENGVRDVESMYPVYEAMQQADMVLSLHGEVPGVFVMDAEAAFLDDLERIHKAFPRLRIVLEHISTAAAVQCVTGLPELVAATITDHHLAITLQDVVGSRIQPHHFCMPVAKRPEDRRALLDIVKKGHPSFFSGTDSAPHLTGEKENACGCAGVFTSPIHMPLLATLFDQEGMLERLEAFTSCFGAEFYGLIRNEATIELRRQPMVVPNDYGGITPFFAGRELPYTVVKD